MDDVASIMGTPDRTSKWADKASWHYGFSSITFTNGRVSEWDNASRNLKVKWTTPEPLPSPPRPSVAKHSSAGRPVAPAYYYDADDVAEVERQNMEDEAEEQRDMIEDQEDRINQLQMDQEDLERKMRRLSD